MAKRGRPTTKSLAMRKVWANKSRREREEWIESISKAQLKRWRRIRRELKAA